MRIQDLSVFGEYSQAENRVTAAFLQICKIGGEDLIRYFLNKVGVSIPSSEIEISTQVKESDSVPDGVLSSTFTFNLYVESKVKINSIDAIQLGNHRKILKTSTDYLLYITPDSQKPSKLAGTNWVNWETTFAYLSDYLEMARRDSEQILEFLVQNFQTLLDNMELIPKKWNLKNENVIILAGSWAESVALRYRFYICQNRRSFKPGRFLAFYVSNYVTHLFELAEAPEDDIDLRTLPGLASYLQEQEPDYSGELRKVFRLNSPIAVTPIENNKLDKNGNLCPFTYGQPRYSTKARFVNAKFTSDL